MSTLDTELRFVDFYHAGDLQEAMRLKLLFDRAGLPYMVNHELTFTHVIPGNIRFKIQEKHLEWAVEALESAFSVSGAPIPEICPACQSHTNPLALDCPECGLFLG